MGNQEELEERVLRHMRITQTAVEDTFIEEEEEEELELPEITPEMEEVIRRAKQSGGQVLVDSHKIQITRKDIDTLNGLNWLNDEIINFYLHDCGEKRPERVEGVRYQHVLLPQNDEFRAAGPQALD